MVAVMSERRKSGKSAADEAAEVMRARLKVPYVDTGRPGKRRYDEHGRVLRVKEPPAPDRLILTLQALRRHNTLDPELLPTDRVLLRWGEGLGSGLPNSEAETRHTHYDPLPPEVQQFVDDIVDGSPWRKLTKRWYRTTLPSQQLAEELRISRAQLYNNWRSSLWYYRGWFESAGIRD